MSEFISIYESAIATELCDTIIKRHQKSNEVARGKTGQGVNLHLKDSFDVTMINNPNWQDLQQQLIEQTYQHIRDYIQRHYMALISAVNPTIMHPKTGEPTIITKENFAEVGLQNLDALIQYIFRYGGFTVQKYDKSVGGYHYWHSEIYPQLPHNEPLHRVLALLYYLNDVDEGGETEFHYQPVKAKPKKGSLVIFPAGFTHSHKGHIPFSNDKYVVTAWLMFNRAEQLYAQPNK